MNRVLLHLNGSSERRRRRLAAAQQTVDQIHQLAGGVVEATCRPLADDDDHRLYFFVTTDIEPTGDYAGAADHLACELRHVIDELAGAVDRLETGKGGAA